MTYAEKLRDPRWQRLRLEIMQRDDFKCVVCRSASNALNVHHKYYEHGLEPWEYPNDALVTLCEPHHKHAHALIQALTSIVMRGLNFDQVEHLTQVLEKAFQANCDPTCLIISIGDWAEMMDKKTDVKSSENPADLPF